MVACAARRRALRHPVSDATARRQRARPRRQLVMASCSIDADRTPNPHRHPILRDKSRELVALAEVGARELRFCILEGKVPVANSTADKARDLPLDQDICIGTSEGSLHSSGDFGDGQDLWSAKQGLEVRRSSIVHLIPACGVGPRMPLGVIRSETRTKDAGILPLPHSLSKVAAGVASSPTVSANVVKGAASASIGCPASCGRAIVTAWNDSLILSLCAR